MAKGGKVDCVDEGLTILRGIGGMIVKMFEKKQNTSLDTINLFEILADFIPRCNYMASLEGLIVVRYIKSMLN